MNAVLRVTLITGIFCSVVTLAYAQGFFGGGNTTSTPAPSSSSPVLSADQFKQSVNQRNKQVQANVSQQAARVQSQLPPPPKITGNGTIQGSNSNPPPRPQAPAYPQPAAQNPTATAPPAQPAPVDTYSGFGTGNQNNNSNSGGSTNGGTQGGWNVTY